MILCYSLMIYSHKTLIKSIQNYVFIKKAITKGFFDTDIDPERSKKNSLRPFRFSDPFSFTVSNFITFNSLHLSSLFEPKPQTFNFYQLQGEDSEQA